MTISEKRKTVADFITSHKLGVVATVHGHGGPASPSSQGGPEAAVVEYGEVDDFSLVLDVFSSSRKFKNISENPKVAFVIGWENSITLQFEGVAQLLEGKELERCKEAYFAKNPRAKKWDGREGVVYIKLIPTWIRYSDLKKDPWEVFELTDF